MGLLDMLMRGGKSNFTTGTVGPMGQAPQAPLNLQNPMPTLADINAQRPAMGKAMTTGSDWMKDIYAKRAATASAPAAARPTGPFAPVTGLLGGAWDSLGVDYSSGPLAAIMGIFNSLGGKLGGSQQGAQTAPAPSPRPAPVQFDPQAYLQSRLGGNTPSYPQIKMPF